MTEVNEATEASGSNGQNDGLKEMHGGTDDDQSTQDGRGKMILQPWHKRFGHQWTSLCKKQVVVYTRSSRATLLRLLAPFFFMFLLWMLDLAFKADNDELDIFQNMPNPSPELVDPIPSCSDDVFARSPCWDFVFTPNTSAVVNSIVDNIRANNPGRPIPAESVLSFASIAETNAWMLENPERVIGAYHFELSPNPVTGIENVGYILQLNTTTKFFRGSFQEVTFFSGLPMQVAAEREIARYQWEASGRTEPLEWQVETSQFAHPTTGTINLVGQAIGPMVFAANLFNFIILLSSIVAERERGLRQALTVAGMVDSAFWMSWLSIEMAISVLLSLILWVSGAIFQFSFFLDNSFFVVFLLFVLFQWAMVGYAFFISTMLSKSSTAINLGFVLFILGWIAQSVINNGYPYEPDNIDSLPIVTLIFTLWPWSPLAKAGLDLGKAAEEGRGLSWSDIDSYCQDTESEARINSLIASAPNQYWDFECVFSVRDSYIVLFFELFLYVFLAIYLDNVLKNEQGMRKPLWYCLSPTYWCGWGKLSRHSTVKTSVGNRQIRAPVPRPGAEAEGAADADVVAEEERMKDLLQHRTGSGDALALDADRQNAVELLGLQKAFFRQSWFGKLMNKMLCRKSKEFWAIKESWFAIERGRLFCLLGPNGAGKTTTINCLTGVLAPTGGDALVYGESLSSPGGLERVRAVMGVCPQFDMLWDELTGREHLLLYGRIKGLPLANVKRETEDLLASVNLTEAANQRSGAYSGGMKRRLSVAIALLGDPLIVYLDEPTTGMDPISRRQVWDIIQSCKAGRAVVLTTHSMEEADILGDKIAIMARGRVRAIGPSLRLKQRFGAGYQLAVATVAPGPDGGAASKALIAQRAEQVKQLFKEELDVTPSGASGGYIQFLVPKDQEPRLPALLRTLQAKDSVYGVSDVQIGLTTLEEVFLNIARQAELEAAEAEGRSSVSIMLEGGNTLKIPLGDEYVTDPSTGIAYHIRWAQDESGNLQVLRWTPVNSAAAGGLPRNRSASSLNNSRSNRGGVGEGGSSVEMTAAAGQQQQQQQRQASATVAPVLDDGMVH